MNIIGDAYVDIHARDKNFERQVRKMVRDIKPPELRIVPKVLMTQANKTLREFHKRNAEKTLVIKAAINTDVATSAMEQLYIDFDGETLSMNVDVNHQEALEAVQEIKDIVESLGEGSIADVTARANTASAELALNVAARDRISTIHVEQDELKKSLQDVEQIIASSSKRMFRTFTGNSGGGNPLAKIFRDPEIVHAMTGFGNAAAGIIPLDVIKTQITSVVGNFEGLTVHAAKVGTALGSGITLGLAGLGSGIIVLKDVAEILGGISVLPAIIGTVLAATSSLSMAWQDMGDAMSTDLATSEKAMAKLPPGARETARALREVNVAVNEATDKKYWDTLGDSIALTARAVKGPLTDGMGQVAVAMADNTKSLSESLRAFATSGDMKTTFDNMVAGLQNASGGTRSFSDALLTLTREGSKRMPHLGQAFTDIGESFDTFIQKSADSGAIVGWIDTSVQRLKELGTIASSTLKVIGRIGQAAETAGLGGLTELSEGFDSLARAMDTPAVRSGMTEMFRSAKIGTESLGKGFGDLMKGIGNAAPQIGNILVTTSEAGASVLSNLGSMIGDTGMMDGFVKFFQGVRDGFVALKPSFMSFGEILGDLGEMGGELFRNIAPGLNILMGTIEGVVENLKQGFLDVNPVLNEFVQVFTTMISGPIQGVGALLGTIMTAVSKMPLPLIGATVAVVGLLKAVKLLSAASLGTGLLSSILGVNKAVGGKGPGGMSGAALAAQSALGMLALSTGGAFKKMGDAAKEGGKTMGKGFQSIGKGTAGVASSMAASWASSAALASGAIKTSHDLADRSKGGMKSFGTAASGMGRVVAGGAGMVRGAFAGLGALIGANLPLALIAGAATVFMHFQQKAQESQARITGMSGSFDMLNGKFKDEGVRTYTKGLDDLGNTFSSSMGWAPKTNKLFEETGVNIDNIRKTLGGSVAQVRDYGGSWNHVNEQWDKLKSANPDATMKPFLDNIRESDPQMVKNMGAEFDALYTTVAKGGKEIEGTQVLGRLGDMGGELHAASLEAKTFKEHMENIGDSAPNELFKLAESGGKGTERLRDALAQADQLAGSLRQNFAVLAQTASSTGEKLAAYQGNQSILGTDTFNDTSGLKEYYEGLDQIPSKYTAISESLAAYNKSTEGAKVKTQDLYKNLGGGKGLGFDMQIPAARQLHSVIGEQADLIDTRLVGAYDNALKSSKTTGQATTLAVAEAKKLVGPLTDTGKIIGKLSDQKYDGTFIGSLRDDAKMTIPEIENVVASQGMIEKDIRASLSVDGAAEAIRSVVQAQVSAEAFSTGKYEAVLTFLDDEAKTSIAGALGLAEDFTAGDFKAKLAADTGLAEADLRQLMLQITSATDGQQKIIFDAMTDDAQAKITGLKEGASDLERQNFIANVSADTGSSVAEIQKILDMGKKLGTPIQQTIDALYNNNGAKDQMDAVIKAAKEKVIQEIEQKTKGKGKAEVQKLKDDATKKIDQLVNQKTTGDGKKGVKDLNREAGKKTEHVIDQKVNPAKLPVMPKAPPVMIASEVTPPPVTDFFAALIPPSPVKVPTELEKPALSIDALIPAPPAVKVATELIKPLLSIASLIPTPPAVKVPVAVEAGAAVTTANAVSTAVGAIPASKSVAVNASSNASGILGPIPGLVSSIAGKAFAVTASSNASSTLSPIPGLISSIAGKAIAVTASSNAAGVLKPVPGLLGAIGSKVFGVTASSNASAVLSPIPAALAAIVGKAVAVTASSNGVQIAGAVVAALANIKDKKLAVTGTNNQALAAINQVNGATVANKSATITITTINRSIDANADGGMYMNNVRTFASGGLNKVQKAIQRHKAIGGGENRVAQIAKGSENYRVWGETETGGEAYLPLGKSKRARSLKILKQVMDHFGIVPGESFADGGFLGGTKVSGGATTFASGGTTTKTSSATKKALEKQKEAAKKAREILVKMTEDVRDFAKSLNTSLDTVFNRSRGTDGQKAMYNMRDQGKEFYNEYKKTRPKEAKKMANFNSELLKQSKSTNVWNKKIYARDSKGKNVLRKRTHAETASVIANDAQRRQKRKGVQDFSSKFTVRDYEHALATTEKGLEKAKAKLENLVDASKSHSSGLANTLFNSFDLGSLVKSKDEFGYRPPTTSREISSYASKKLKDMQTFQGDLSYLRGKGYNKAFLADVGEMGLEDGLAITKALRADNSQKNSINTSYTKMFGEGGQHNLDKDGNEYIGGVARKIGVDSADSMFKAGVAIQQGLVNGLTADVKALEKAGQTLSDTLIKKFKKLMGIKSPSKVFTGLGKFLPQGLVKGIDSQKKLVDKSIGNMVDPSKANLNLTPSSYRNNTVVPQSGIIDKEQTSDTKVQVIINPSEHMSEEQIGKSAARELQFRLDSMTI